MGSLEIRVLGELQVLREGKAIGLPASKKTRALLGYLVVEGGQHLRERLCSLLWDGPDDPRAALRWSLSKLRPVVDDEVVRLGADREHVSFRAEEVAIDLHELGNVSARGLEEAPLTELVRVAERMRGELLEGLDLHDCHRFQEWCVAEREAARMRHRRLLDAIVERTRAQPEQSLPWARRRCAIDPFDEEAHAEVVRLLGGLGRVAEARAHYEQVERMFASELGRRAVSAVLVQARRDLGREVPARAQAIPAATVVAPKVGQALVGRDRERRVTDELAAAARAGAVDRVLVVVGEPGIGKSRLLDELAGSITGAGGTVLRGRGFEAELVRPYGAWIDALRTGGLSDELLAPLLRGADDRAHLLDAVVAMLRACRGPTLVVLDDLQWIDEASVVLLHFAARALAGSHVLVACAARPGELGDNPAALKLLRSLARERRSVRIDLAALGAEDVGALLRAHGCAAVDPARVHADSGGNPLYALEVARALARGAEPLDSLDELLRDRLEALEPGAHEIVGWAAAFGGTFALDPLQRASGIAQAELLAAIEQLAGHGFVRPRADAGGYDFAHDLVRTAAYRSLAEPRRRLIHLHIARALHALDDAEGTLADDVARHAGLGGEAELCARACLIAARRSLRLFATRAAIELAQRGLRQIDRMAGPERLGLRVELLRVAILADTSPRRADVLEREMERAVIDARAAGLLAEVTAGLHALAVLHYDRGEFAQAEIDTVRAEQIARAADDLASLRSLARSGMCLAILERELDRATTSTIEARQRAEKLGVEPPELLMAEGLLAAHRGEDEAAVERLERGWALGEEASDHYVASTSLMALARIALERGDWSAARRHAAGLRAVAVKLGEGSEGPIAIVFDVLARAAAGEPDIEGPLASALQTLRDIDNRGFLAYALDVAAALDLDAGRIERARARADEALASATLVRADNEIARAHLLLARIATVEGDRAGTAAHLHVAGELATADRLTARVRAAIERAKSEGAA